MFYIYIHQIAHWREYLYSNRLTNSLEISLLYWKNRNKCKFIFQFAIILEFLGRRICSLWVIDKPHCTVNFGVHTFSSLLLNWVLLIFKLFSSSSILKTFHHNRPRISQYSHFAENVHLFDSIRFQACRKSSKPQLQ